MNKGFQAWGKMNRYYNMKLKKRIDKYDITLFPGTAYITEFYEGGLKTLICPNTRLVRNHNLFEEFLNSHLKNSKNAEQISRYFAGMNGLLTYGKRTRTVIVF